MAITALFTPNDGNRFAIKYINNKTVDIQKRLYDTLPKYDKFNFFRFIEKPDKEVLGYILDNIPDTYNASSLISHIIQNYPELNADNKAIKKLFVLDGSYATKFALKNSIILNDETILEILKELQNKQVDPDSHEELLRYISVIHQEVLPDKLAIAFYEIGSPLAFVNDYISNRFEVSDAVKSYMIKKDNQLKYVFDHNRTKKPLTDIVQNVVFNLKRKQIKTISFEEIAEIMDANKKYILTDDETMNKRTMGRFRDLLVSELLDHGIELIMKSDQAQDDDKKDIPIGSVVNITSGPFEGFHKKVISKVANEYHINVEIFGKTTKIKLDKSFFQKI